MIGKGPLGVVASVARAGSTALAFALLAALLTSALALSSLPAAAAPAVAAPGTFSFAPSSPSSATVPRGDFTYTLGPSKDVLDSVELANVTGRPEIFEVFPADAYNISRGGGFALRPRGYHNVGVGSWLHLALPDTPYTVPPHTKATIPFTVVTPSNASPGDHAGGIVALDVTPVPGIPGRVKVQVNRGVGVPVFVRVPGPLHPGLAVSGLGAVTSVPWLAFANGSSKAVIHFQIENIGNVVLNPVGRIRVTDIFGRTVKTFRPVHFEPLLPGSRASVTEPVWKPLPVAGPENIVVRLGAAGARTAVASDTFWIIPWLLVAVIVLLLALVAWWWRRRRRRAGAPEPIQPEPSEAVTTG